jgi:hypothetical protein
MPTEKRQIEGRDFWFSIERPYQPDPETGELHEAPGYYVAFSVQEPSPLLQGEIVQDDQDRARLFPTPAAALEAGIKEVKARLSISVRVFAVGLPGGTTQSEFAVYTRLLREEGTDPEARPRVEDSFGRRWHHVWDTREAAERFAARLRRETGNANWEVYELTPLSPPAGEAVRSPNPITILIGRQSDGNTYSLHPSSFKLLRERFPQVRGQPSVFIGRYRQDNHEATWGSIYDQVATLLTGLSPERLRDSFGGYRVVDPTSHLTLWESRPAAG